MATYSGGSLSANGVRTPGVSNTDFHTRRLFDFSDRIAELAPEESPFFVYLSKVGKLLESRPDIVNQITSMVQGGQPESTQRISLEKDEFDPWEAYNDPASKSYKFRQQELQDTINNAVEGQMAGVQKQVGMNELKGQLQAKGLNDQEVNSFFEFASKNPSDYGVEGAINMWKAVTGEPGQENNNNNPLDSIRQNQAVPQQGGIFNGEQPIRKDEKDSMWDSIMKAGSRANVL